MNRSGSEGVGLMVEGKVSRHNGNCLNILKRRT